MIFGWSKRKPRQFEYRPRFYDQDKEQRQERRREILGEKAWDSPSDGDDQPYKPGQYIRDNMKARRGIGVERAEQRKAIVRRVVIAVALIGILGYFMLS